MNDPIITTYSMWSLFRNCRMACKYRYTDCLVSIKRDKNLYYGSVIHECLEMWHQHRDISMVLEHIDKTYVQRSHDDNEKSDWHMATAMMNAYAERYHSEKFTVIELEKKFEGSIVNPSTGAASRSFKLAGKVDGIVQMGKSYYLLEHKTAATIDGSYLERLWTDFQITLYAWYVRETLNIPIVGIIYNILGKTKLQQSKGETEAEYEARRQALIAKSKTGKTSAKRKMPESDESFQERLAEKYANPEMFCREMIYISHDRYDDLRIELWKLTQSFLEARRKNCFYRNTAFCFRFNRACAYYPICSSNNDRNVIENYYQVTEAHEELNEEKTPELPF